MSAFAVSFLEAAACLLAALASIYCATSRKDVAIKSFLANTFNSLVPPPYAEPMEGLVSQLTIMINAFVFVARLFLDGLTLTAQTQMSTFKAKAPEQKAKHTMQCSSIIVGHIQITGCMETSPQT